MKRLFGIEQYYCFWEQSARFSIDDIEQSSQIKIGLIALDKPNLVPQDDMRKNCLKPECHDL